jgi:hypothetical protein
MCKPQLVDQKSTLVLEEDKLKVSGNAADIEVGLKQIDSSKSVSKKDKKGMRTKSYELLWLG